MTPEEFRKFYPLLVGWIDATLMTLAVRLCATSLIWFLQVFRSAFRNGIRAFP
jgi:hypothetical protein